MSDRTAPDADTPDDRTTRLAELVAALGSANGTTRQQARHALVRMGEPATGPLIEALGDRRRIVRWEAAKALVDLRDTRAVGALVRALGDRDFSVRWLAAKALIALEDDTLPPLLHALGSGKESFRLQEGALHVLKGVRNERTADIVDPVLAALRQSFDPEVAVPIAAEAALGLLHRRDRQADRPAPVTERDAADG